MKTANEIQNALDNIRYYAKRIKELSAEQLSIDMQNQAVDTDIGEIRFNCLGTIYTNCDWLNIYCDNIGSNLRTAVEQDRKLVVQPEE